MCVRFVYQVSVFLYPSASAWLRARHAVRGVGTRESASRRAVVCACCGPHIAVRNERRGRLVAPPSRLRVPARCGHRSCRALRVAQRHQQFQHHRHRATATPPSLATRAAAAAAAAAATAATIE